MSDIAHTKAATPELALAREHLAAAEAAYQGAKDASDAANDIARAKEALKEGIRAALRPSKGVILQEALYEGRLVTEDDVKAARAEQTRASRAWSPLFCRMCDGERALDAAKAAVAALEAAEPEPETDQQFDAEAEAVVSEIAGRLVWSHVEKSATQSGDDALWFWPAELVAADEQRAAAVGIIQSVDGIKLIDGYHGLLSRPQTMQEALRLAGRRLSVRPAFDAGAGADLEDRILAVMHWLDRPASTSEVKRLLGVDWPVVLHAMNGMRTLQAVNLHPLDCLQGWFYRLSVRPALEAVVPPADADADTKDSQPSTPLPAAAEEFFARMKPIAIAPRPPIAPRAELAIAGIRVKAPRVKRRGDKPVVARPTNIEMQERRTEIRGIPVVTNLEGIRAITGGTKHAWEGLFTDRYYELYTGPRGQAWMATTREDFAARVAADCARQERLARTRAAPAGRAA